MDEMWECVDMDDDTDSEPEEDAHRQMRASWAEREEVRQRDISVGFDARSRAAQPGFGALTPARTSYARSQRMPRTASTHDLGVLRRERCPELKYWFMMRVMYETMGREAAESAASSAGIAYGESAAMVEQIQHTFSAVCHAMERLFTCRVVSLTDNHLRGTVEFEVGALPECVRDDMKEGDIAAVCSVGQNFALATLVGLMRACGIRGDAATEIVPPRIMINVERR
jgi:hypothetical protein